MKIKTILTILIFIFFEFKLNAQNISIEDLGKATITDVKRNYSIEPCLVTPNKVLTYCVSNGNKISYVFENNKLINITYSTLYNSKNELELEFEKIIKEEEENTGKKAIIQNGRHMFILRNSPIFSYYSKSFIENNWYLIFSLQITR